MGRPRRGHRSLQLLDGQRVIREGVRGGRYLGPLALSVWRRIGARFHGGDGVHERTRIDREIQVGGRRQVRVAEEGLRDLQIAAGFEHGLRDGVTKLMRAHRRADLAPDQPQRRLEGGV